MKDIVEKLQNLTIVAKKERTWTGDDIDEEDIKQFVQERIKEDYSKIESAFLDEFFKEWDLDEMVREENIQIKIIHE